MGRPAETELQVREDLGTVTDWGVAGAGSPLSLVYVLFYVALIRLFRSATH